MMMRLTLNSTDVRYFQSELRI